MRTTRFERLIGGILKSGYYFLHFSKLERLFPNFTRNLFARANRWRTGWLRVKPRSSREVEKMIEEGSLLLDFRGPLFTTLVSDDGTVRYFKHFPCGAVREVDTLEEAQHDAEF